MPSYLNGRAPADLLVVFNRGENSRDGKWTHSLPPATYARLLAVQARAFSRTGRHLRPGEGWTCYRPYAAQVMLKNWYTAHGQPNMSAQPGTSSHGLFWEGKQCAAIDLGNWDDVYDGFGGRAAFYEDCRAVGLTPGLIHPSRNRSYPDEPWHVNDMQCWGPVPAFDGIALPFHTADYIPEDDMPTMNEFLNTPAYDGGPTISQVLKALDRNVITGTADAVWARKVKRPSGDVEAIQELADIKTIIMVLAARAANNADINEGELAAALAPLIVGNLRSLDAATITAIAKASADEEDRRERQRLAT